MIFLINLYTTTNKINDDFSQNHIRDCGIFIPYENLHYIVISEYIKLNLIIKTINGSLPIDVVYTEPTTLFYSHNEEYINWGWMFGASCIKDTNCKKLDIPEMDDCEKDIWLGNLVVNVIDNDIVVTKVTKELKDKLSSVNDNDIPAYLQHKTLMKWSRSITKKLIKTNNKCVNNKMNKWFIRQNNSSAVRAAKIVNKNNPKFCPCCKSGRQHLKHC
ncbi:hypothetical protein PIROE2DRAFT_17494 [Piromyces sp. E2]|nr:hypothetical protein PIROE2DRAFT_17494 [Piromyces sp. E2]|eukprot:OUM57507.1 hypothetical protein PIROE2DRAFT_17494 [Piromyces sp. E2]